jgi:hypothetical protein
MIMTLKTALSGSKIRHVMRETSWCDDGAVRCDDGAVLTGGTCHKCEKPRPHGNFDLVEAFYCHFLTILASRCSQTANIRAKQLITNTFSLATCLGG